MKRLLEGRGWNLVRLSLDAVLLYLAVTVAWVGAPAAGVSPDTAPTVWLLPPLAIGLLALRGGYRGNLREGVLDRVAHVVGATSLAAMSLLALESLASPDASPGAVVVRAWLFGTIYLAGGRTMLGLIQRGAQANRLVGKPTLIVGAGRIGAQVERRLRTHPEYGLLPIGYLDVDPVPGELVPGRQAPVLGPPSELGAIAEQLGARHVIFAFLSVPDHVLVPLVRECEERGLEMSLVPRLFESVNTRVVLEHMGGLPLYGLRAVDPRGWQFAAKHFLGQAIALVLLLALTPLLLAISLGVKLTSPGSVIFRQPRIGRDGAEFDLLKFRSMRPADASPRETPASAAARGQAGATPLREVGDDLGPGGLEGELRLTPIGRFIRRTSLDELPQLWNVVRGDMDLVGPRPERPEFVELFGQSIRRYDDRHRVKSGVTGWAQVHGLRGRTSLADRVEWDNYYIENWSLWLDLKILLMTLAAPFRGAE